MMTYVAYMAEKINAFITTSHLYCTYVGRNERLISFFGGDDATMYNKPLEQEMFLLFVELSEASK